MWKQCSRNGLLLILKGSELAWVSPYSKKPLRMLRRTSDDKSYVFTLLKINIEIRRLIQNKKCRLPGLNEQYANFTWNGAKMQNGGKTN